jgi:glycosyltransferase involved in cell wall biosynthesis
MPRILRIHNRLIIGGPTLNVLYLTKYLAPEFETLLVVGEKEDHEKDAAFLAEQMGIKTVSLPDMGRSVHPIRDYKAYGHLKEVISNFKPSIVHTHAAKPGAVGRMAARSMKVPVIVHTYHGHVFHSYFNKFKTQFFLRTERYLATKSDALIAISEQQKRELANQFRVADENKFRVIPLGFELNKFLERQEEKRKKFRTEFNLDEDEIAIGIIGRLVSVKNHVLFLKGLQHVLSNSSKKIKAFIVGDGETKDSLKIKAQQLNISFVDVVSAPSSRGGQGEVDLIFTSWRSDIDVINAGLDIIALTSLNEGTPVSLIEAQAANKPIVSTRVGGIGDIVIEGKTALLSETNDADAFKQNLLNVVEDDGLRKCLGKNGADHVQQRFGVDRLANDMSALYRELLAMKRSKQ